MSLATRCPSCGTIFRVVQDQLKVSEGWVRCGQCHEVFHGIEALFDLDTDPALAARRAARAPAAPPPTRVFAEQRANAPIPMPAAPGARPSAPITSGLQPNVPAQPAYGAAGLAPPEPSGRAPQTGFTPAAASTAPAPHPLQPVVTRGSIAPRFAARLAEESVRAQSASPAAPWPDPVPADRFVPARARAEPSFTPASTTPPFPSPPPEFAAPPLPEPPPYADFPVDLADTTPPPEPEPAPLPPPEPVPAPVPISAPPPAPAPEPEAAPEPPAPPWPAPVREPASGPSPQPEATAEPVAATHRPRAAVPSRLVDVPEAPHEDNEDEDDERAGPPTLASMLPEDAGEWPPRRKKSRRRPAQDGARAGTELALVDHAKDPRFLREARRGARWRRPWVRATLSAALVLLLAAAVAQVAWPQRDVLASRWPVTRPAWAWLCEQAGCRIEAPRSLASLALDGSSLTRTDTDHVLLFSADLHNRADHEVRMPSFELAFMDLNGEIVARKVLTPAQIGIRQTALPADGELHVHARLGVGTLPASGFQADLFYP